MKRYLLVIETAVACGRRIAAALKRVLSPATLPIHSFTSTAVLICLLVINAGSVRAQQVTVAEDTAYIRVVNERAGKIVAVLGINDAKKYQQVQDIIALQYRVLNQIHEGSKVRIKELKEKTGVAKEAQDAAIKTEEAATATNLARQHDVYINKLKAVLTEAQIEQVKDGMTYRVLPLTYQAHLDMIPTLTDEQKKQIYAWLVEARDHAMDAESSEKKHWWFGKYKGRINNYLAAQGYDLKKERDAWELRKKEKAAK